MLETAAAIPHYLEGFYLYMPCLFYVDNKFHIAHSFGNRKYKIKAMLCALMSLINRALSLMKDWFSRTNQVQLITGNIIVLVKGSGWCCCLLIVLDRSICLQKRGSFSQNHRVILVNAGKIITLRQLIKISKLIQCGGCKEVQHQLHWLTLWLLFTIVCLHLVPVY